VTTAELHASYFRRLESPRLCLRPLTTEDAEDMFAYTSVPESFRFLKREAHQSAEEDRVFIQNALEGYRQHREFIWGIVLTGEDRLIGTCRLFDISPDENSCEVSYLIRPAVQRRNIASEAVSRLIAYAFEELKLSKVYARCAAENIGSERVMQKCGMRRETVLPHYAELHGRWQDFLLYSIENEVKL